MPPSSSRTVDRSEVDALQNEHDSNVRQTYMGLRLAMPVLVLMLFLSVIYRTWTAGWCLQTSISAYYYTPARPVFIAALCAIGVCLIVYRGNSTLENLLLDFAGFLALAVALVPTQRDTSCGPRNTPSAADVSAAVGNNVPVLLAIGTAALAIGMCVPLARPGKKLERSAKLSIGIAAVFLAAGLVFFVVWRGQFEAHDHIVSAIVMFLCIAAVAISNAKAPKDKPVSPAQIGPRGATVGYFVVAVAMVVTIALVGLAYWLAKEWLYGWSGVFWAEAALIVEFAAFWVIQTLELQGEPRRHGDRRQA